MGYRAQHTGRRALLVEHVDTEASETLETNRAIKLQVRIETRDLLRVQDARHEASGVLFCEGVTLHGKQFPIHSNPGRTPYGYVEVTTSLAHHQRQ